MEAWAARGKQESMFGLGALGALGSMGAMGGLPGAARRSSHGKDSGDAEVFKGSRTASMTTTVCMSQTDQMTTLDSGVMEQVSIFGDVCRIDMSLAAVFKCALVTFFDVRSAMMILHQYADRAEPFPASVLDCRTVRVKLSMFFEDLTSFGEVAYSAVVGGFAYVEYFDLRAAQMLMAAAREAAHPIVPAGQVQQPVPWLQPGLTMPQHIGMAGCGASDLSGMSTVGPPPGLSPDDEDYNEEVEANSDRSADAMGAGSSPTTTEPNHSDENNRTQSYSNSDKDATEGTNSQNGGYVQGRFAYTKVSGKEFSKYDIDLDRITQGKDQRTTVMVRKLMGPRSREDMMLFLERSGLAKRYSFFYMPCKERKKTPTGFAFINFNAPADVHQLCLLIKSGAWHKVVTNWAGKAPEVSYARVQGHDELAAHFRSSAVLHEWDPSKRPIFKQDAPWRQAGGKAGYSPKDDHSCHSGPRRSPAASCSGEESPYFMPPHQK